ncbi:hypothetical protein IRJ41_013735 [Triplophysa rosa]|uniref:Uncharacterized protein n=1 Tax=Triplophysa rosa TaxID=992332 RepID=A0A9W7WK47_TRIRA|nr:hypothetical protein IRJ41_013735 [Triplophysa rosa]
MTLTESEDAVIRTAAPRMVVGRKWTPSEAVQSSKSALQFRDVVGQVQHGTAGFGLIPKTPLWHKATSVQKRQLVVEEVRRQEEGERHAKAVSMAKQGRWTNWEGLEKKKLSWRDIWQMEGARLIFVIRATYDLLPSPQNLKEWYGEDPACSLCQTGDTEQLKDQGHHTYRDLLSALCISNAVWIWKECSRACSLENQPEGVTDDKQGVDRPDLQV